VAIGGMSPREHSSPGFLTSDTSKISKMISRARSKCAAFRSLLLQGRELLADSEISADEDSEGGIDSHAQGTHTASKETGPVYPDLAPVHEGGLQCWRRVRVYNQTKDRWEMAVICEMATDSAKVRVTYTQGGSEWIDLRKKSVLEQGEVVWAKMGRKYPWWPAQVLLEIGMHPAERKANEVTVEWLGENTVAQVNGASVVPYNAHLEEYKAPLSSSKKLFGFQRNLVRPALDDAQQRIRDLEYHHSLVAQQLAHAQHWGPMKLEGSQTATSPPQHNLQVQLMSADNGDGVQPCSSENAGQRLAAMHSALQNTAAAVQGHTRPM